MRLPERSGAPVSFTVTDGNHWTRSRGRSSRWHRVTGHRAVAALRGEQRRTKAARLVAFRPYRRARWPAWAAHRRPRMPRWRRPRLYRVGACVPATLELGAALGQTRGAGLGGGKLVIVTSVSASSLPHRNAGRAFLCTLRHGHRSCRLTDRCRSPHGGTTSLVAALSLGPSPRLRFAASDVGANCPPDRVCMRRRPRFGERPVWSTKSKGWTGCPRKLLPTAARTFDQPLHGANQQIAQRVDQWRGQDQAGRSPEQPVRHSDQFKRLDGSRRGHRDRHRRQEPDEGDGDRRRSRTDCAYWRAGTAGQRDVGSRAHRQQRRRAGQNSGHLLANIHDDNENIRYWAVEGLAYLATDETISPLLEIFHDDPSASIRQRAACGLAQSGMFSAEQRRTAVPTLLDFAQDGALDDQTREWVFQAFGTSPGRPSRMTPRVAQVVHGSDARRLSSHTGRAFGFDSQGVLLTVRLLVQAAGDSSSARTRQDEVQRGSSVRPDRR